MARDYEYKVGGSLEVNAPSYVVRQADYHLYQGLKAGALCYVFNSRQMGKTSLLVRTMKRLQADGFACAVIDISGLGSQEITIEQWYASIIDSLVTDLNLIQPEDLTAWWDKCIDISPVRRLGKLIDELLLPNISQNIVIFLDEIDSILRLDFPADDFFALIRSCYQKRAYQPEYQRLTFALVGVATPSDLIQDEERTPFNIGRAIQLDGFKIDEAAPLIKGLEEKVDNPQAAMEEILAWTGGQPLLTQKVCKLLEKKLYSHDNIVNCLQQIITKQVIENWESQDEPPHLKTIKDRIIANDKQVVRLLGLYQQILRKGTINVDDSPEQMKLRLSGLVVEKQRKLKVYNKIYQSIFNVNWTEKQLANLRPYAEALKTWVDSKYQDDSQLLRGEVLQDARIWASGKSLSDEDYKFLVASEDLDKTKVRSALEAEKENSQILASARHKAELDLESANQRLVEVQRITKRPTKDFVGKLNYKK